MPTARCARRTHRSALAFGLLVLGGLRSAVPVAACDACGFFDRPIHRTGSYALVVALDRSSYDRRTTPRLSVTVKNSGRLPIFVDTRVPVWNQTAMHIERVGSGAASQFDKPLDGRRGRAVPPGASYRFPTVPLTAWGLAYHAAGTYVIALSYGTVDSNLATFRIR